MPPTEYYRQAAIIAQSTLHSVIRQLHKNIGEQSIGEVCRFGDELINAQIKKVFTKIEEKGIAKPTEICKNEFSSNVAPEEFDTFQGSIVNNNDVLKISLGVHINGYTAIAAHTIVVREQPIDEPVSGPLADALIGTYLATEAVVSVLCGALSESHPMHAVALGKSEYGNAGTAIRKIVESIADDFNLLIVPNSKIRRIKRFVAGQPTVRDTLPSVQFDGEESDFVIKSGQTYLVDIQLAPKPENGTVEEVPVPHVGTEFDEPSVYTRDQTVKFQLRTNAARQLLAAVDQHMGVYSFKLSYLLPYIPLNLMKLGLKECVQRHLLVGESRKKTVFVPEFRKESIDIVSVREATTCTLVSNLDSTTGYLELLRLTGGKQFPANWALSERTVKPGLAADALNARLVNHNGVRYVEIKARRETDVEM